MSDSNIVEYDSSRKFRLSLSDLAKVFNVPVPVVRNYIKHGLPHQQRGEILYFDLRESVQWYREYSARQLKEYKQGRAASQHFLRELVNGQEILDSLYDIDKELQFLYDEQVLMAEKFQGANQHLLDAKGKVDPDKLNIDNALNSNKQAVLEARRKLLESRRSGLESLLRKKLPDLKSVEVGKAGEEDQIDAVYAMFAEVAKET